MNWKLLIIVLLCTACGGTKLEKVEKPANTLSREKMQVILKEIHYIETKAALDKLSTENLKKRNQAEYDSILSKHSTTDQIFFNSLNYFYKVPDTLTLIYENVLKEMSKDQARIKALLQKKED